MKALEIDLTNLKINPNERLPLQKDKWAEFIKNIMNSLDKKLTVLLIVITGSRGKCLYTKESDFDVKVVYKDSYENYLLQKISKNMRVNTTINLEGVDVEVEGQAIEVLSAFQMSFKTNSFASEILRGMVIYEHDTIKIFDKLKEAYLHFFNLKTASFQINGLITSELSKMRTDKKKEISVDNISEVKAKQICEVNYLLGSYFYLIENAHKSWINTYTIYDYLQADLKIYKDNEKFLPFMISILNKRLEDKNQIIVLNKEEKELVFKLYKESKVLCDSLIDSQHRKDSNEGIEEYEKFLLEIVKIQN